LRKFKAKEDKILIKFGAKSRRLIHAKKFQFPYWGLTELKNVL